MAQLRRRLLRPATTSKSAHARPRDVERLSTRLHKERTALTRLNSRLKRVFHAFARQQTLVARLEKRLTKEV